MIRPITKRQFELYALGLEQGPNFEPSEIYRAYVVGRSEACGCILFNPTNGFTTLAMRRRIDHCWVLVDRNGPFTTPEEALNNLSISMRGGDPPEPLAAGVRKRALLRDGNSGIVCK